MVESPQQNALYLGAWEEPVNSGSFLQLLIQGLLKEKEIKHISIKLGFSVLSGTECRKN